MHFQKLQAAIGYTFKDPELLHEALTHPSLAHENGAKGKRHNQRLEFLGDGFVGWYLSCGSFGSLGES